MAELLLCHEPPVAGDTLVVEPTQIEEAPFTTMIGFGFTVTGAVGNDTQPEVDVNTKVTLPAATPVTTPDELFTVAIDGSLLVQVPPVVGVNVVVPAIQMLVGPDTVTVGLGNMAMLIIGSAAQPAVEVNVKMAVP